MKIRILSDLHLEFADGDFDLPVMDDEADTTLVIAGDLGVAKSGYTYTKFLRQVCDRFKDVLYINGNHEFYNTSLLRATTQIKRTIDSEFGECPSNLHYDDHFVLVRDDVVFICATLWTDMNNGNPLCIQQAHTDMNDYKVIRNGPSMASPYQWKLRPVHTMAVHQRHKEFIKEMLLQHSFQKCVVVTHHAPSYQSVAPEYIGANSGAYVSEFYDPYEDEGIMPYLHIHGHVHDSFDYKLDCTRVICNPRGYVGLDVNPNFDPNLVVEL